MEVELDGETFLFSSVPPLFRSMLQIPWLKHGTETLSEYCQSLALGQGKYILLRKEV